MTGKVAIVTGGSRGIGAAISQWLAGNGINVVVNYASSSAAAEAVVDRIAAAGGKAVTHKADVSSPSAVADMFEAAAQQFGGVDIVVNSAGILELGAIAEIRDAEYERIFATNVQGTFNVMREAAKRLNDNGRVINLSSTTLALNAPGYGIYNATKGAVEGMTRVAAKELGARGITVNAVAPGPVATEFFLEGKSKDLTARLASMAPQNRLGEPDDVAGLIAFLASPDSGWVNGQVIRANGGIA